MTDLLEQLRELDGPTEPRPGWDPVPGARAIATRRRRERRGLSAVAALAVLAVAVPALTTHGGHRPAAELSALPDDGRLIPVDQRESAPPLSGPSLRDPGYTEELVHGRVTVVNLWGSWCTPCREEAPALAAAATQHPHVAFLGVDTQDVDAKALEFEQQHDVSYDSITDHDGTGASRWAPFPEVGTPVTVVLDAQGRVAARHVGFVTGPVLEAMIVGAEATPTP